MDASILMKNIPMTLMIVYKERQRIIKRVHAERSGADYGEITIAGTL
jgi:hypothetical protein